MIENNPAFLQALEDVCDEEYESYLKSLEIRESHTFSQKHNKKMQKLIKRQQKPYYVMISTAGRRAACIAAAIIILSASALSVKAVREAVFDFITHIFSDHTVVTTDSGTDAGYPDTIEKEYYISALPEGFEETARSKTDNAIHIAYYNNDDYILFTQCIKSKYNTNYDNEHTKYKEFTDSDGQKYMMFYTDYNTTYIWDNGEYVFEIHSNLNEKDIMKLCKSTKAKE